MHTIKTLRTLRYTTTYYKKRSITRDLRSKARRSRNPETQFPIYVLYTYAGCIYIPEACEKLVLTGTRRGAEKLRTHTLMTCVSAHFAIEIGFLLLDCTKICIIISGVTGDFLRDRSIFIIALRVYDTMMSFFVMLLEEPFRRAPVRLNFVFRFFARINLRARIESEVKTRLIHSGII